MNGASARTGEDFSQIKTDSGSVGVDLDAKRRALGIGDPKALNYRGAQKRCIDFSELEMQPLLPCLPARPQSQTAGDKQRREENGDPRQQQGQQADEEKAISQHARLLL